MRLLIQIVVRILHGKANTNMNNIIVIKIPTFMLITLPQ